MQIQKTHPRNRAAALVLHDNSLLVMHRKNTHEYYTFPGGGVDAGESNVQAVIREIKEETSLDVVVERQVYELHYDTGDIHYYFLCRSIGGDLRVQPGTDEYTANEHGDNVYTPQWMPIENISSSLLYPLEIRDQLLEDIRQGFSDSIVKFNLIAV